MRWPRRRALGVLVLLGAEVAAGLACQSAPKPVSQALLAVYATPSDARVYVDERYRGLAKLTETLPLRLSPGERFVTIVADGHFPHDLRLALPAGLTRIDIKLRKEP